MISKVHQLPLKTQCNLLHCSRSQHYYQPKSKPTTNEDSSILKRIDTIYTERPFLGIRRITDELHRQGLKINHKKTYRLMKEMGIMAIYPKPKTTVKSKQHKVYPYLLRNLDINRSNQVWVSDITYSFKQRACLFDSGDGLV